VAVGQALEDVEAMDVGRPVLAAMTQVPFADQGGGVAESLERLGDGQFAERQAAILGRLDHLVRQVHPHRIAAGHQACAGGGAEVGAGVEVAEPRALGRHPVEVGGADDGPAVAAQVAVAQVVGHDDDDVRLTGHAGL
jgi:hypothetical protein